MRRTHCRLRNRRRAQSIPVSVGLALLAVVAASRTTMSHAGADQALGQFLSSECVTCHQITGRYEGIPPIIGLPEAAFIEIMGEYRTKTRANPIMQMVAGRLSEEEVAALAAYFGNLTPEPAPKARTQKEPTRRRQ